MTTTPHHTGHGCTYELLERLAGVSITLTVEQAETEIKAATVRARSADRAERTAKLLAMQTEMVSLLNLDVAEQKGVVRRLTDDMVKVVTENDRIARNNDTLSAACGGLMQDKQNLLIELAAAKERIAALEEELGRAWPLPAPHKPTEWVDMSKAHDESNCEGPDQCPQPSAHPELSETWAVPKCNANRWDQTNPEHGINTPDADRKPPAPFCVSEHCQRCNAYRREVGMPELSPNSWMSDAQQHSTTGG